MSYLTLLQDTAAYYGGEFRDLPVKAQRELCGEWLREVPPLEIFDALPDGTARYLFSELLGELIEHGQQPEGYAFREARRALLDCLLPYALARAERAVEEQYDVEAAPCEDHGMTARDFGVGL